MIGFETSPSNMECPNLTSHHEQQQGIRLKTIRWFWLAAMGTLCQRRFAKIIAPTEMRATCLISMNSNVSLGRRRHAALCDRYQLLVFAPVFWNGRDPILKERLFGLTPHENHGEDVKEYYRTTRRLTRT